MLTSIEQIIFLLLIVMTAVMFLVPVYHRLQIILSGNAENRFKNPMRRIGSALTKIFLQRCTLKNERFLTGFVHVFVFYGALTFDTVTINHMLEGFIPNFYLFGHTNFGLLFSFLVNILALLVLGGVLFFSVKRFIFRPKAYATSWLDSGLIYFFLTFVTLSYFYFECFAIAHHPGTERLAFLGGFLAKTVMDSGLPDSTIFWHFKLSWWLHILFVYAFIVYVPHSKYFHMFAGSVNLFFRSEKPTGTLKSLDIENTEVFGLEKASDHTWKDLLDTFACMECGRCQDVCPASASEKPLSPKMIIYNLKKHLLEVRKNLISKKRDDLPLLMDRVYTEGEIWTCTSCGACMHVCPVEIEHIPKIIGVRQSQVMMESRFPAELNSFFRNLETNNNPWGIGLADRANWTEGLKVPLMSGNPGVDYLFWVGCAGSFDEEGKAISRAMAKILDAADIRFAILGTEEKCCGDSAKRLGNDYLFQMQARENLDLFKKYKVKKIIVTCPHGYNTFKNDYPLLLDLLPNLSSEDRESLQEVEVIHHSKLIAGLINQGRLPLRARSNLSFTYHDPCYLGRHNGVIKEPREVLSLLSTKPITELFNNREHSFCCGAGGGLMWTEESLGRRINHMRIEEVMNSQAEITATSCAFCLTMLKDALKDREHEDIKVKDIAQLVAESLED